MGFQKLDNAGIYRTNENNWTYSKAYTVTIEGGVVTFHGLTTPPSREDIKELHQWMRSEGFTAYEYKRLKRGRIITIHHDL